MSQEYALSVIIPSYCSQPTLGVCLQALEQQKGAASFEVVVVDCSPGGEVDAICQRFARVRLIKCPERFNPGIGRNIGAAAARSPVLVFVDADIILQDDALKHISSAFAAGQRAFGGALEMLTPQTMGWRARIEHYYFMHQFQRRRPRERRKNISAALMVMDRVLFHQLGGFKDIARMQDTEFSERLQQSGVELIFEPSVVGYVIYEDTLRDIVKKVFINGNNIVYIRAWHQRAWLLRAGWMLALPLLTFLKVTRIVGRQIIFNGWQKGWIGIVLMPVLYGLGGVWMLGVYYAMVFNRGISRRR